MFKRKKWRDEMDLSKLSKRKLLILASEESGMSKEELKDCDRFELYRTIGTEGM